jgi:NAD(P) transhydrogenase
VAIIEREPWLGGAGVNTGTIPSKTLRETALYFSGLAQRGLYGVDYTFKNDMTVQDFLFREREVVRSLRNVVARNIARHQIDLIRGDAYLEDANTVRVARVDGSQDRLHGEFILIATGSLPNRGRDIPFEDARIYDSDTILGMPRLPRSLGVIGAGVIGCEYGSIFRVLGVQVTMVDGRDRLLPFLDGELSGRLRLQMELLGVGVRLNDAVTRVVPEADAISLELRRSERVRVDAVLFAAGRLGATHGLGLEELGIATNDRGHIAVNDHFQTVVPNIYAAGDVLGSLGLAATAMEQARIAISHAFDLRYQTRATPLSPMAVYTIPEVAMAGETEESAGDKGIEYEVGRALYPPNARGQITGDLGGLVKLVFRADDKRLIGVHILGEGASEIVHVGLMVMQLGGTIETFIEAVFNYPTLGDAYKAAAYDGLGNLARARPGEADLPGPV